jgi:uncharacterized membrane protein YcgQ (UPF0703/DUF1980 family)
MQCEVTNKNLKFIFTELTEYRGPSLSFSGFILHHSPYNYENNFFFY